MRADPRHGIRFLALAAALCLQPDRAGAQADSTRADTLQADSASADSASADTARFFVATLPLPIAPGPRPWGERHVFNIDSLRFTGALTLSDLLARIPGVFVARGGFLGQAEPVFYAGRGAAGIDVYWDGVPLRPLGRDSVMLDAGRIPLAPLERVEVVRLPDRLRVNLVSARSADTEPRTAIAIITGDLDIADYRAAFSRRWRSGFGISLLADFTNLDGDPGTTTGFRSNDLWMKLEFVPRSTWGASFHILRSDWDRNGRATLVDPLKLTRSERALRAFVASRSDGLGWRGEAFVAQSSASGDTALARDDRVTQTSLELSHRTPRTALVVTGRVANDVRPHEIEANAGWLPLPWLNVAVTASQRTYEGELNARRVAATAGVRLPLGLSARAEIARGGELSAPRWSADTIQTTVDWLGAVRWDTRWWTIEVARAERDAFQASGFSSGLRTLALLGPTPRTSELTVHGSIRPLPGLELSGWYADPIRGGGDFQLPHHARYAVTFFSKFWRVYRSGVFGLRAEVAAESWSRGLGGVARDALGNTSQLFRSGATFLDLHFEIQIVGVTLFWQMRNANAMRNGYASGLDYPSIVQFYGARWTFLN